MMHGAWALGARLWGSLLLRLDLCGQFERLHFSSLLFISLLIPFPIYVRFVFLGLFGDVH